MNAYIFFSVTNQIFEDNELISSEPSQVHSSFFVLTLCSLIFK